MSYDKLSPLEIYKNKTFKLLIVLIPSIALCAGLTFTVLHALNYYPTVKTTAIVIFDCTCVFYTLLGLFLNRRCEDKDGFIRPKIYKLGKFFIALLMCVQWNFISYMIPSRDFWVYAFYFVVLAMSFFDSKFILIIIAEISGSLVVSWLLRPELLPVKDELYFPEMALRGVMLVLCFSAIYFTTYSVEKRMAEELEKVTDFDTLTLLYNRRKLESYLESAESICKKDSTFSVIMADIDNFKIVNDTYGHGCGDVVLKNVADIINLASQDKGVAFRYGGEEMLVLVYSGIDDAAALAEEMRKRIEGHTNLYEDKQIKVTLTFGVAEFSKNDTFETLLKRADDNLYYGKNNGKNCVIK